MWLDATASERLKSGNPTAAELTASTVAPACTRPAAGLDAAVGVELGDLRPLVDPSAALEQGSPQAEGEPRRLHGRVQA